MNPETTFISDMAIHPGEYLEEVLENNEITKAVCALRMGCSLEYINDIINGRRPRTNDY